MTRYCADVVGGSLYIICWLINGWAISIFDILILCKFGEFLVWACWCIFGTYGCSVYEELGIFYPFPINIYSDSPALANGFQKNQTSFYLFNVPGSFASPIYEGYDMPLFLVIIVPIITNFKTLNLQWWHCRRGSPACSSYPIHRSIHN
jgi:hypothetical protein